MLHIPPAQYAVPVPTDQASTARIPGHRRHYTDMADKAIQALAALYIPHEQLSFLCAPCSRRQACAIRTPGEANDPTSMSQPLLFKRVFCKVPYIYASIIAATG